MLVWVMAPVLAGNSGNAGGEGTRAALVIGNGAYRASPLANPVGDAQAVAAGLKRLGFQVTFKENTGRRELLEALREFANSAPQHAVRLFYYAGHGVQLRGRNYLVPIDASMVGEEDLPSQAADLTDFVERLGGARNGLSLVVLDACRNNPFGNATMQLADARATRTRSLATVSEGLAPVSAPSGALIAYSTAPGAVAADSPDRRHSVYTKHFLQWMNVPGITVERMFKNVRIAVALETRQKQVPWETSSLMGEFCFQTRPDGTCG
jgi:carboxyl-terminal processing protease